VDNIKMDFGEIGCSGIDRIVLTQGRDKWRALVKNGNEPSGVMKCWNALEWLHNWWPLE
jgi:hypothetical protein